MDDMDRAQAIEQADRERATRQALRRAQATLICVTCGVDIEPRQRRAGPPRCPACREVTR